MYSTRYTVHRHQPSGWAIFWLVMLVLFFVGLLVQYWYVSVAVGVAVGTYKLMARGRRAAELERARLLHNAYQPQDGWLTPEQWAARHQG
jgi:hypothetical protein